MLQEKSYGGSVKEECQQIRSAIADSLVVASVTRRDVVSYGRSATVPSKDEIRGMLEVDDEDGDGDPRGRPES